MYEKEMFRRLVQANLEYATTEEDYAGLEEIGFKISKLDKRRRAEFYSSSNLKLVLEIQDEVANMPGNHFFTPPPHLFCFSPPILFFTPPPHLLCFSPPILFSPPLFY